MSEQLPTTVRLVPSRYGPRPDPTVRVLPGDTIKLDLTALYAFTPELVAAVLRHVLPADCVHLSGGTARLRRAVFIVLRSVKPQDSVTWDRPLSSDSRPGGRA